MQIQLQQVSKSYADSGQPQNGRSGAAPGLQLLGGAVRFSGQYQKRPVSGEGYVELTGYNEQQP